MRKTDPRDQLPLTANVAVAHAPARDAERLPPLSHGTARIGWIRALPHLLRDFGIDADGVIADCGIAPSAFDDDHNSLDFRSAGRLLERCVRETDCRHFALLLGARFDAAALGEIASQMAGAATVRDALQVLILRFHLLDEGAVPMLMPVTRGRASLAHSIYTRDVPALDQFADLAATIIVRILMEVCGGSFQPLRVTLPHRTPADPEPFHRVLGRNIAFNAELTSVVFDASWLDRPVADGGAARPARSRGDADRELPVPTAPLAHLVRRALRPMVFTGTATEPAVARMFALHPRSLRRQLRAEGESFLDLLNGTRLDIVQQLLRDTDLRVAEIAAALHYSDASALTRAYRARTGVAPAAWRHRERTRAAPPATGAGSAPATPAPSRA